jgi:hypothetical protein
MDHPIGQENSTTDVPLSGDIFPSVMTDFPPFSNLNSDMGSLSFTDQFDERGDDLEGALQLITQQFDYL